MTNSMAGWSPLGVCWATWAISQVGREGQVPGVGVEVAADQGEQARLAAAVGAHQPDLLAGMNGQVRPLQEEAGTAAQAQVPKLQHLLEWVLDSVTVRKQEQQSRNSVALERSHQTASGRRSTSG